MDFITIDNFEGPMDLLLHLVKESNIDIFDISITDITDKYMEYINNEENLNINISSSYLVMASELMYLKSKSLLPCSKDEEVSEEDSEELTREKLINRLIEYEKYKNITPEFKELEKKRKDIFIKAPEKINNYIEMSYSNEESLDVLVNAFKKLLERKELDKPLDTVIASKEYSVKKRKSRILDILSDKRRVYLDDIIEEYNRSYIVVSFISILELVKEKSIIVKQNNNFDRILVELR